MKVIIMAGGMGTRIQSVRSDVPKPMIEINGKPILQYQIENLKEYGLTDITIGVGHLGNVVKNFFEDGSRFGVNISYFTEDNPMGTAGALFKMLDGKACEDVHTNTIINEDFLLINGDLIFDIDFPRFIKFHKDNKAWASLMAHPNGHPYDGSLLVTETISPNEPGGMPIRTNRVIKWMSKEDERLYYRNLVNAGVQIISYELLKETAKTLVPRHPENPDKIDLDRDVLKPNIMSGRIFAYETPEYIKDMGTPERFYETESDIINGKVHARNLSKKQKAIFLDRDGTINKCNGFITKPEQFELLPGASEAIKKINKSGYLAIIITNQPVIARGDCTFEELDLIHKKMETELGKNGAFIDGLYFCPHHTDKGYKGERPEYKCECECRKPKTGLFKQAINDFNIDISCSFMIGDSINDVEAGLAAGCKESFLLEDNQLNTIVDRILRTNNL